MLRAVFAFLALPTMVAGVIPWGLSRVPGVVGFASWKWALPLWAVGLSILVAAVISFWRRGRGTLAPWDPPRHLVVRDLYRFNRNPMYVGVALVLAAWAVATGARACWVWALVMPVVLHLRVVLHEEPEMQRSFGEEWERYRAAVPRWGIKVGASPRR